MSFSLTKHHGLGNDFLVLLTSDAYLVEDREQWSRRAIQWCNRPTGVGADGLLIGLRNHPDADLVMTLFNADGSVAEMSGNGIRCLVQAEAMRRGLDRLEVSVLTDGGLRTVALGPDPDEATNVAMATVDMGPVSPGPVADRNDPVPDELIDQYGTAALGLDPIQAETYDLGNPHLVVLVPDVDDVDVAVAGRLYEQDYDGGMNVHFVAPTVNEEDAMTMRVWERGVGPTEACGTGATAVAYAAHEWGLVGETVTVTMPGGDVVVDVGPAMFLYGPTAYVADVRFPE